jgi:hypothetical protein
LACCVLSIGKGCDPLPGRGSFGWWSDFPAEKFSLGVIHLGYLDECWQMRPPSTRSRVSKDQRGGKGKSGGWSISLWWNVPYVAGKGTLDWRLPSRPYQTIEQSMHKSPSLPIRGGQFEHIFMAA